MRVSLTDVDERVRLLASRRLREKRWNDELRPDIGYRPSAQQKQRALNDAIEAERAALFPKSEHLLPERAVDETLAQIAEGRWRPGG